VAGSNQRKRIIVSVALGAVPFLLFGIGQTFGTTGVGLTLAGIIIAIGCYTCPVWYD
jgi:multidrug efflux pump subunit AcrB